MMRSLFSGVSGLKSHQTRMDVIGNNIANVNTTGYKSKALNFSDMLYQTTQAASGPSTNVGGINPRQIGLGVKTAAINTTITQEGATQSTGNPFDLKLTGEAFFVVSDGTKTYYTRDGSFNVDEAGNLCMASTGYIVQGYQVGPDGNIIDSGVGNLNVMSRNNYEAAATTAATVSGLIDKTDANLETKDGKIMNLQILDSKGYEYNLKFGILPQKSVSSGVRNIQNNETEYAMAQKLYKVDTSKLSYSYELGTGADAQTKKLSSINTPEMTSALEDAIWAFYANGTQPVDAAGNTVTVFGGSHAIGATDDAITVNFDEFIRAKGFDYPAGGELKGKTITVTFSGDTQFVASDTAPTYPLSSDLKTSKINESAVGIFYSAANAAASGSIEYTLKSTDIATITSIKQDFEDDNGNAITDYKFNNTAGTEITMSGTPTGDAISSDLYGDIMKVLGLGTPGKISNYVTNEAKQTESIVEGKYTISLLEMSSYGEPVDIESFLDANTSSWELSYNPDNGMFEYVGESGSDTFTLNLNSLDQKFSNITIDLSDTINQFNEGKSSISADRDDGRTQGTMTGVSIANDGIITANYSNGMSAVLGQICVGTFANAMGLQNEGDNLYSETANSGRCNTVDIKASGTGYMTTGVLEMSNVDLSQEFTDMITTQRGFQANSRIITTSDSLLEELVNLKR